MITQLSPAQIAVCKRFNVSPVAVETASKAGIAQNVRTGQLPLNGFRHPPTDGTTGWFVYAGEVLSAEPDFFLPLHAHHISEWCPAAEKFLALPPGWRFLLTPDYEDVWFDESLLAGVTDSGV